MDSIASHRLHSAAWLPLQSEAVPTSLNAPSHREILTGWRSAPRDLFLADSEVHVWRVCLEVSEFRLGELQKMLSADERERAARFRFQRDRNRFVVGRGCLRQILGRYSGTKPDRVRFKYGANGKPSLAGTLPDLIRFNLSHSDRLMLLAVSKGREIGIDVEKMDQQIEFDSIAERFFSSREQATLQSLPEEQKCRAFFACWTRKEAFIKALGDGLSVPLDSFDVSLAPGEPAALLESRVGRQESEWCLQELPAGAEYVAAMVVQGDGWRLRCWSA